MHGWYAYSNGEDAGQRNWSKDKFVKGDVYTDAERTARFGLTSNYYLPAVDVYVRYQHKSSSYETKTSLEKIP